MFRESVTQYPTFAARDGQKSVQNGVFPCCSSTEEVNTLLIPPPSEKPQTRRARLPTMRSGAEKDSKYLIPSIPGMMIATCKAQNAKKVVNWCPGTVAKPPQSTVSRASRARPPSQVWIPNQRQATRARAMAATFAPRTPNEERTKTGKGTPYCPGVGVED